jgi:hypothetical protein
MSMIDTTDIEQKIAAKIDTKSTSLMKIEAPRTGGVAFADMSQVMDFAKAMAVANIGVRQHLRGNVGACLAITVQAIEWGMSPFAVASKSYSVNNQIAYEAQLINAVILRRAPIAGRFKISYSGAGNNRVCTVALAMRDGTPDATYESPTFGTIQPKNSPLWKTDPDQQQFYYSSRALCRRHFPDVLLGVYAVDELIDSEPEPPRTPRGNTPKSLEARLGAMAADSPHNPETGEIIEHPPSPHEGEAQGMSHFSASNDEGKRDNEPAGGVPPGPAEAALGPLEGAAVSPPGAAAPSYRSGATTLWPNNCHNNVKIRDFGATHEPTPPQGSQEGAEHHTPSPQTGSAPSDPDADEILATGDERAKAGTAALRAFLEELRQNGEGGRVTSIRKASWHDTAKAADAAKGARK